MSNGGMKRGHERGLKRDGERAVLNGQDMQVTNS